MLFLWRMRSSTSDPIGFVNDAPVDIVMRTAPTLSGTWSSPRVVYHPPEEQCPGVLTYAAKAHPELSSPGLGSAVAVTYATNNLDFGTLVRDTSLYFPRFVKLDVATGTAGP